MSNQSDLLMLYYKDFTGKKFLKKAKIASHLAWLNR
jgi:hypothetical protein